MDAFIKLRKQAREKRNSAIEKARDDYTPTLTKIAALEQDIAKTSGENVILDLRRNFGIIGDASSRHLFAKESVMPSQITVRTTKGDVTFDGDDCELITIQLADENKHEMKQPHISIYFGNKDFERKCLEQVLDTQRQTNEYLSESRRMFNQEQSR